MNNDKVTHINSKGTLVMGMPQCYTRECRPCLYETWAQPALADSTQLGPLLRVTSTIEKATIHRIMEFYNLLNSWILHTP